MPPRPKPTEKEIEGTKSAPGQRKTRTLVRPGTDEVREVTQEEWRVSGKQLRAEGWRSPADPEPITVT
jgi:hypothetical protein